MAEPEPRDDPEYMKNFPNGFLDFDVSDTCFEEDRDFNLEEEPTKINPEICVDVFARKPQVKDSASCSAIINEATKKTYASSSRNREDSSESGEIRRVDNKEDDRNDGDVRKESDPQQQLTRTNPGSTSSTSDRNNTRQLIVSDDHHNLYQHSMASQQNFYQLPVVNQIRGPALVDHNYEPWRLQNTYHQHPSANQMTNPMPGPMWPIQHPMAYQQNFYQHPMSDMEF
ncbi:unnamed protein product [Arabidopsis lyrata]|nr:unnamed protein product [Arabidopsis lyrata]